LSLLDSRQRHVPFIVSKWYVEPGIIHDAQRLS
jgi:hypothetical protein